MFWPKKDTLTYIVVFFIIAFLLSFSLPSIRSISLNTLKYPLDFLSSIGSEIEGLIYYHRNYLENKNFKRELDFLRRKTNQMQELELENKRLKNLLDFKESSDYKVIAAKVIGRAPDNWQSVIIIDRGSRNGIKRGFIAIDFLGLVGRVIEVSGLTSRVMLINDPNLSVSAIDSRSRQEGIVSGTLGNRLIMRYLLNDADVKPDDKIFTSGLTELYPKGLLIGTVLSVDEEFSGLGRYAIIKPAVNLSSIEEVLIIIP